MADTNVSAIFNILQQVTVTFAYTFCMQKHFCRLPIARLGNGIGPVTGVLDAQPGCRHRLGILQKLVN